MEEKDKCCGDPAAFTDHGGRREIPSGIKLDSLRYYFTLFLLSIPHTRVATPERVCANRALSLILSRSLLLLGKIDIACSLAHPLSRFPQPPSSSTHLHDLCRTMVPELCI